MIPLWWVLTPNIQLFVTSTTHLPGQRPRPRTPTKIKKQERRRPWIDLNLPGARHAAAPIPHPFIKPNRIGKWQKIEQKTMVIDAKNKATEDGCIHNMII